MQDAQIQGGDPLTENGKRLYLAPQITAKPKRVYKTKRWNEMYKQIKVTTKDGKEHIAKYSDYYILDGFLTVYRDEKVEDRIKNVTYPKFHTHYALDCVISIEVIE